jgi:DNA-binding GntR family transcriptional regulator
MPRARMRPDVKARLVAAVRRAPPSASRGQGRNLVVDAVRKWIFDGDLRDGEVISQDDLADVLGLSRIPVRDGLIALESGGWVVMEPGSGARAIGLDEASIRDSFELFGTIWSLLIRRAVERKGDTAAVVGAGARVRRAATALEMTDANDAFVAALKSLAGAPRLDAAYRNASRIVPGDFFSVVPDALAVQRRHVPRIGRAIDDGDDEAGSVLAMAQHRAHARNIVRLLNARGSLA